MNISDEVKVIRAGTVVANLSSAEEVIDKANGYSPPSAESRSRELPSYLED